MDAITNCKPRATILPQPKGVKMKTLILILATLTISNFAHAVIPYSGASLSSMLGEYDAAKSTDENSTVHSMYVVVFPNSSGQSGIAANKFQPGSLSSTTGKTGPAMYKASGGALLPVVELVSINTSTDLPIPLVIPAANLSGVLPLAGGTMSGAIAMATFKITGLGDPSAAQDAATKAYVDKQAVITCTAGSGGAATEVLVCTGLVATDTVLAVTQKTPGANSLALIGWSTLASNAITGIWAADPGASAVVQVLVRHL